MIAVVHPPLIEACRAAGLDPAGARLLHARANHTYHLPTPGVVVRLRHTRGSQEWERRLTAAVEITTWLAARGFPTVEPWHGPTQAVTIGEWTATFWRYLLLDSSRPPATSTQLAELLRELHTYVPPVRLVPTNPLGALITDLNHADQVLTDTQRDWLRTRATQISERYPHTPMPLGRGMIHGDAHTGNVFPTAVGRYVLGDWDSVSYGPRAQDLVPTLDGVRHFGQPRADWIELCAAYGVDPDIEHHPGIRLLCAARELRSLAAYIRSAPGRPDIHAELSKRLRTLMDGIPALWRPV